jgi:hypothetical protein
MLGLGFGLSLLARGLGGNIFIPSLSFNDVRNSMYIGVL